MKSTDAEDSRRGDCDVQTAMQSMRMDDNVPRRTGVHPDVTALDFATFGCDLEEEKKMTEDEFEELLEQMFTTDKEGEHE